MSINNLNDLFEHLLKDIYYAEKQIHKALPDMAKKADSSELRDLLNTHAEQTATQISRLEQAFEMIG